MIGRDLKVALPPARGAPGRDACEIAACAPRPIPTAPSSLAVRRGEILGLAGLVGSGRTELARAVFGIDPPLGGRVRLDGEPRPIASPRDAIARGIYLVPEDRKRAGPAARHVDRREHSLPDLAATRAWRLIAARRRGRGNAERQRSGSASGRRRSTRRSGALRRQPAEGGAGQVAVDAAQG